MSAGVPREQDHEKKRENEREPSIVPRRILVARNDFRMLNSTKRSLIRGINLSLLLGMIHPNLKNYLAFVKEFYNPSIFMTFFL